MSPRRILVFSNAKSGSAVGEAELAAALNASGAQFELMALPERGELTPPLRAALSAADVVAAAGGDGTISTVAGIMHASGTSAMLGVLPLGTCNDLSRALDVPADLEQSVRVLVNANSRPMDLIETDTAGVLINQANGGFAGALADSIDADVKSSWGPLAYWRTSIEVLQQLETYEVTLVTDNETCELAALNLSVANAPFSGGGVPLAPQADFSDGLMDVVVVERRSTVALAGLLPRVLSGTHLDAEGVTYLRARELTLHSTPDMPFSIDGEVHEVGPSRFRVLHGALRVVVPG